MDIDHFNPSDVTKGAVRARWQIPAAAPLIGLVGRIVPYKGHEDLLRAVAGEPALSNAHVLIVGKETEDAAGFTDSLRNLAVELGIGNRVHFTGVQDAREIYADLDVLAVPSWEEPFGLVVVEAMAMQVPVVAYCSGGIPEIIRSGVDGLLVAPRATHELAQALLRLCEDPDLRLQLGVTARRRVIEKFSPSRQAAEMATLYRRLATQNRRIAAHVTSGAR